MIRWNPPVTVTLTWNEWAPLHEAASEMVSGNARDFTS